jgi:hypothetical protein
VAEQVVIVVDHLGFFLVVIIELVVMSIRHHVDHLAVLIVHFHIVILTDILQQPVDFLRHLPTTSLIVRYQPKHYVKKINPISMRHPMI